MPAAAWRIGGALAGPTPFGCRLCAVRRTGTAVRVLGDVIGRQAKVLGPGVFELTVLGALVSLAV
ncbi:hypothetical protein ACFY4I_39590 [Streptomyces scabiei]|uniref:hypothetical protein n=1 Tax=Streptomyces scabiei TaxID=1930 RepID=UPI0036BF02E5